MKEAVKEAAHKGNTLLSDSSYIKLQKVQTKPYDRKQTVVAWGGREKREGRTTKGHKKLLGEGFTSIDAYQIVFFNM